MAKSRINPKRKFPVLDQSHFKSRVENDLKQKCCYRGLDIGKRFGGHIVFGAHSRKEGIKSEPYRIGKSPNVIINPTFASNRFQLISFT